MQGNRQSEKQQLLIEAARELRQCYPSGARPFDTPQIDENWTVQEKLQTRLYWLGLTEQEAEQIVDRVKALPSMSPMCWWSERAEEWPQILSGSLWDTTTAEALKWIDENPAPDRVTANRRGAFRFAVCER